MDATTKSSRAKLSYYVDILSIVTVLLLCVSWIHSIQSPSTPTLSQSFLDNGFCLSPLFDNTHFTCFKFDAFCGLLCLTGAMFTNKTSLMGVAAYFFSHAYGHYDAAVSLDDERVQLERIEANDIIVLAAILSIGPLGSASQLIKVGKVGDIVGKTCALLGLGAGVAVYVLFFKRPCYALLYINIFIILANSLPRCILVGYRSSHDVEIRSSNFRWASLASGLAVLAVVFCEPFFCDSFLRYIGGHAVFDIVLAVDMIVQVLANNAQACEQTTAKKVN